MLAPEVGRRASGTTPGAFDSATHTGVMGPGDSVQLGDTLNTINLGSSEMSAGSFSNTSGSYLRSEIINRGLGGGGGLVSPADALEIAQSDRVNILHDRQMRRKRGGSDLGVPVGAEGAVVGVVGAAAPQAPPVTIEGMSLPPRTSRAPPSSSSRDRDRDREKE